MRFVMMPELSLDCSGTGGQTPALHQPQGSMAVAVVAAGVAAAAAAADVGQV